MQPWALIFDVDGVIADTEALNARASAQMFAELYGVTVSPADFYPFIGTGDERYVEGVAEQYGVTIDTEAAVARRAENFQKLLAGGPLPPTPGLLDLVRQARAAGHVTLAIATSGRREKQCPVIEGTGLELSWFAAILTGEQVTRKKPDPQIYQMTAKYLRLLPERCVVVEDAPAGVAAAKAAGMWCVGLTTSAPPEALTAADWAVASLEEVTVEKLERLLIRAEDSIAREAP
jgi:HAD superfamily hydrolase (TIGR01509 family)